MSLVQFILRRLNSFCACSTEADDTCQCELTAQTNKHDIDKAIFVSVFWELSFSKIYIEEKTQFTACSSPLPQERS